ncbi:caspase family protein [Methylobacterium nonmethylotrophicum]|uniref:Caspase family protein n=1 Tax=Methylobacterium nonmethylotrophicum TaxID=1141884 RepID=A0A4Z0NHL5_9HYPH|nr:caspase family protein [Methylobacterium nonmethylotrophicum]TGD95772.1 caspase family protein [Methylobacterium nonmethylotrophicum]
MPPLPCPPGLARACAVVVLLTAGPAQAGERLALVIGNSAYRSIQPLPNPAGDARLIAQRLRELGFSVQAVQDADLAVMRAALRDFSGRIGRAGKDAVALLYYAGHGVQDDKNRNYLIPVDAQLRSQADLVDGAVKVEYVQELLEDARPRIALMILDACRNNPLPATSRGGARGLAPIDSRMRGTFIAFSTAPGQTALDGDPDGNSPYATALAAELERPAGSFEETFRRAHLRVLTATNGAQIPWTSSSVVDEFSFAPPASPAAPVRPPPAALAADAPAPNLEDPDLEYQKAVLADSILDYERFLQRFPRHARRDTVVKLIALKREDMLWRQIEQAADANQQVRMLDRLINAFPDGAYLDRARRRRADLIERLSPSAAPVPPPGPIPSRPLAPQPGPAPSRPPAPQPPPRQPGAVQVLAGARWAIASAANCGTARKTYRLSARAGTIEWRDGAGNVDVEAVLSNSPSSLTTETVRSIRPNGGGVAPGSRWTYDLSALPQVRVQPAGKAPFTLVPCR